MKNETTNSIIPLPINISLAIFVIGSIFKIQHWPYGIYIVVIGLCTFILLNTIEIRRLKKIIGSPNPVSLSLFIFMLCGTYKILNYPHGVLMFNIGVISYIIISHIEIRRLRRIITVKDTESQ